ncbi:hypothetical protein [Geodermatophilus nigrescens]|uniref:hypothetical protein n=1 Tax=Geodermatophilus nigrescens TaxID=1070870 RepID=UPI00158808A5|nr:hypothetical protein [Geodermatophilus nigrescens]
MQVVERRVEVPVPTTPTRHDWPGLLSALSGQIDSGRVYDRDLLDLLDALETVLSAYRRRAYVRSGSLDRQRQARTRRLTHRTSSP